VNAHRRNARALAAGAFCLAFAGVAVAAWSAVTFGLDDGGYIVPVVCFLYGSLVLAWTSSRECAAGRAAAEDASPTRPGRQT
jgi:K+ transporter